MAAGRMAVMEIGAQDVIMKVYEIAPRKGMQVIDSLRRMVAVGKDTYSEGRISTQVLEQICNAFTHFKQTLAEYGITEYYALANSLLFYSTIFSNAASSAWFTARTAAGSGLMAARS